MVDGELKKARKFKAPAGEVYKTLEQARMWNVIRMRIKHGALRLKAEQYGRIGRRIRSTTDVEVAERQLYVVAKSI